MDPAVYEKMAAQADYIMGPFADMVLRTAKFPPTGDSQLVVLDQACGSGVVSSHIMAQLLPDDRSRLDLTCADISEPAIAHMKKRIETSGWSNARAVTNDAMVRGSQLCAHR
jgi:ubiquinone/menaquinone biosynthesis C-methylase UbiE